MTDRTDVMARSPKYRAALLTLSAATLAGLLAFAAHAENRPVEHRDDHAGRARPAHDREAHRYDGYYRQPNVFYTAPPVVAPPSGYYQQPGVSLNFNF